MPRCYQNQKEECKECPECWSFGGIWGTWHQVGVACKCDGLCYEGSPDWFTWEETARSKDYADPWAGAGPANFNSNKSVMPMQVPGAFLGGATRSPRKERLQNNRLAVLQVPTLMARWRIEELKKKNNKSASDHWGLGNPRMTNHHSNRRMIPPRMPGQSSQTAHVGMVRPRMGLANQNIQSNRMVNMHSRNMNPNLDYNSVMASSGQEAELEGSCWRCIGGLILAASSMLMYKRTQFTILFIHSMLDNYGASSSIHCMCGWS